MKSHLGSILLRLGVSFGAMALILYSLRDKIGDALTILVSEVSWSWFFLGLVTYFLCHVVLSIRLLCVFQVQNISMSFREALYLSFLGLFFNLFFPSAVGGDVAKAYYAYKHSGKKIESTIAVILDRLVGFVAMILIAVVALAFFSRELNDSRIDQLVYVFLGLMLFSLFFFGSKRFAKSFKFLFAWIPSEKWKQRLSDLYHAMYRYKHHKNTLAATILLSFLGQSMFVIVHYWVTRSLNVNLSFWIFFLFVPLIAIVSMAPSIGGLGVREAGVIFFLKRYMLPERALALSLLIDMLIYGFSLAAGIVYALRGGLKAKVIHEMEELES
jgi:hypothetical protein